MYYQLHRASTGFLLEEFALTHTTSKLKLNIIRVPIPDLWLKQVSMSLQIVYQQEAFGFNNCTVLIIIF